MGTVAGQLATLDREGDLASFCPQCRAGLDVFDARTRRVWIGLTQLTDGQEETLFINPRLGSFERSASGAGADGAVADDVRCPRCGASLLEPERRCAECGAPVFSFEVSVRSRMAPLSLCARTGCRWHEMSKLAETKLKSAAPRQRQPEQDATLRVRNFDEVCYDFDSGQARAEAGRCRQCKKPACVEGCPVRVDIPGFVALVAEGKFVAAAQLIRSRNALPAICGRVCPQDVQCEQGCVLAGATEPLAIGALERFAADFERETGQVVPPHPAAKTGRRVAVVGSGPAGLTLAADLVVQGHAVTIYEALHKPGGVLSYGIPEFRLPKKIVDAETGYLRRLGVRFELNSIVGRLYGLDELFELGYDAVYLATGAGLPGFMGIPGENLCNVVSANEYLTRVNLMKAYRFPEYDTPAPRGAQVVVVGGGNVAMDCARTALRMGAREVTIVYRRARADMPARAAELEHAVQEGVRFEYLASPRGYEGDERGWVGLARCVRTKLGDLDVSGRRRPITIPGSDFYVPADLVVVAVGAGPNRVLFEGAPGLERNERGYIRVFTESGRTSVPRVWAGGDIVTGSATVILAMGAARQAADDIHAYLSDGGGAWV
ncbi:MAG: NADPH-dependent glutamate synthase [Thermoleophilia bacterium]